MTKIQRTGVESVGIFDGPQSGRDYIPCFGRGRQTATAMEGRGTATIASLHRELAGHPDNSSVPPHLRAATGKQRARRRRRDAKRTSTVKKAKEQRPALSFGSEDVATLRRKLFSRDGVGVESRAKAGSAAAAWEDPEKAREMIYAR